MIFCYKPIPNNVNFTYVEKNYFPFLKKNSPYLLNDPCMYICNLNNVLLQSAKPLIYFFLNYKLWFIFYYIL